MGPGKMADFCERESAAVEAARSGVWAEELRAHAGSCQACQDAMLVDAFLRGASADEQIRVPEAGLVWWKMQLKARRELNERAMRPIQLAERAVIAAAALVALGTAAWLTSAGQAAAVAGGLSLITLVVAGGSAVLFAWSRK
jgi:hypothetical protein